MFRLRDFCAIVAFAGFAVCGFAQDAGAIKGVVFNDLNGNGVKDAGEPGIAAVPVSDQKTIVKTNDEGAYELPMSTNVTVFVSTPSEWEAPKDKTTGVPQFFKNIHTVSRGQFEATGPMPASLDFALTKRADADSKKFEGVIMGDSQLPTRYFAAFQRDIVRELMGMRNKPSFVMTLGDISSENLSGFPEIAKMTAQSGAAVYGVIGNHDRNYKAENFEESSATYKKTYGPDFYSFDRGDVHFIALNSIYFSGPGSSYGLGFDKPQLDWLKQDLANTPKDKMLMLCMHAPLVNRATGKSNFKGQEEFFAMLEDREAPIMAVGGHWHTNNSFKLTEANGWKGKQPFTMAVIPHACGSWWAGPLDEEGLPLSDQTDGTPNGYSVWNFDGKDFSVMYQPSGLSANFQARIYTPDQRMIALGMLPGVEKDAVLVNAFFTYFDADVEMSLDGGEWKKMEKIVMKDPYMISKMEGPYANTAGWIRVGKSEHMWKLSAGKLEPGMHTVRLRIPSIDGVPVEQGKMFMSY